MVLSYATSTDDLAPPRALLAVYSKKLRTDAGAVSWGAIVAGGVDAATFGVSTILWVK
jgi:hypothetical protein